MSELSWLDYVDPAGLVKASPLYEVVAISQNQELDGEQLVDVLEISFIVTGRPGVHQERIPLNTGAALIATGGVYVPGTGAGYSGQYDAVGEGLDLTPFVERIEAIYAIPV